MKDRKPEPYEMPWQFGIFALFVILPGLLAIMAASMGVSPSEIWTEAKPQLKWIVAVPVGIAIVFILSTNSTSIKNPRIKTALWILLITVAVVRMYFAR